MTAVRIVVILGLLAAAGCDGGDRPARPPAAATGAQAPATAAAPARAGGEQGPPSRSWRSLREDLLHDPLSPGLRLLQEPSEALSQLPPAQEGNLVDWAAALRLGLIEPRTNIYPETKVKILDRDVLFTETAGMPIVRFPHRPHTEWLDCENCHDKLFVAKQGANKISMNDILEGRFCGQCHGAVSFPLTQCYRCHSVPREAG